MWRRRAVMRAPAATAATLLAVFVFLLRAPADVAAAARAAGGAPARVRRAAASGDAEAGGLLAQTRAAGDACPGVLSAPAAPPERGFAVLASLSFGSGERARVASTLAALQRWAAHYTSLGAEGGGGRGELRLMVHAADCVGLKAGVEAADRAGVRVWGGYVGPFSDEAQDHWLRAHGASTGQLAEGDWLLLSDIDELQELGCGGMAAHVAELRAGGRQAAMGVLVDALPAGCDLAAAPPGTAAPLLCSLARHVSSAPYLTKMTAMRYGGPLTFSGGHHLAIPALADGDARAPPGAAPRAPVPAALLRDADYAPLARGALHSRLTLVRHLKWDSTTEERLRSRSQHFRALGVPGRDEAARQAEYLERLRTDDVPGGRAGACAQICADPRSAGASINGLPMRPLGAMLRECAAAAVVGDGDMRDDRGPLEAEALANLRALRVAELAHAESFGALCAPAVDGVALEQRPALAARRILADGPPTARRPDIGPALPPARPGAVPSVLLAGVQKSGTSTTADFLHRAQVVTSALRFDGEPPFYKKEVQFFNSHHYKSGREGREYYEMRFRYDEFEPGGENARLRAAGRPAMDATPENQLCRSVGRINSTYTPEEMRGLRVIQILREPVAREASLFRHVQDLCGEPTVGLLDNWACARLDVTADDTAETKAAKLAAADFGHFIKSSRVALLQDLLDRGAGAPGAFGFDDIPNQYSIMGLYALHLRCWLSVVDRSQILLLSYNELKRDPSSAMRRVVAFIDGPEAVAHGSKFATMVRRAEEERNGTVLKPLNVRIPHERWMDDPEALRRRCDVARSLAAGYEPHNRMLDALLAEGGGPPMEQWPFPRFEGTPVVLAEWGCPPTPDSSPAATPVIDPAAELMRAAPEPTFGGVGSFAVPAFWLKDADNTTLTCQDVYRDCGNGAGYFVGKRPPVPGTVCAALANHHSVMGLRNACNEAMKLDAYTTPPRAGRVKLAGRLAPYRSIFGHTFVLTMPDSPRRSAIRRNAVTLNLKPSEVTIVEGFRPTEWGSPGFEARIKKAFGARLAAVVDFGAGDTRPIHLVWKHRDSAQLADLFALHEALLDGSISRNVFEEALRADDPLELPPHSGHKLYFAQMLAEVTQNLGWAQVYEAILRGGYSNAFIFEDDSCGSLWARDEGMTAMLRRLVPQAGAGGEKGWDLLKLGDCWRELGPAPLELPNTRTDYGNVLLEMSPDSVMYSMCLHAFAVSARFARVMRNASMAAHAVGDIQIVKELYARRPEYRGLVSKRQVFVQDYEIATNSTIDHPLGDTLRYVRMHTNNGKIGDCAIKHGWKQGYKASTVE